MVHSKLSKVFNFKDRTCTLPVTYSQTTRQLAAISIPLCHSAQVTLGEVHMNSTRFSFYRNSDINSALSVGHWAHKNVSISKVTTTSRGQNIQCGKLFFFSK